MIQLGPASKTAIGLVLLTASILVAGYYVGLVPNAQEERLDARKKFCETLAVQLSMAAFRDDMKMIRYTLDAVVDRNPDVVSAAMRSEDGQIFIHTRDHASNRDVLDTGESSATQVSVPIFKGEKQWGTVEVVFASFWQGPLKWLMRDSIFGLILFVSAVGLVVYFLFIKKVLRELDPAVVPERVKSAFNSLAEGLLILDEKGRIVLANATFADKVKTPADKLAGSKASKLPWERKGLKGGLPWAESLQSKEAKVGVPLQLQSPDQGLRTLMVNSTPIADKKGTIRGALVTFDDMTDMEKKHQELETTLDQLVKSEEELRDKTVELEYLATRDPLTGSLNRRSFLEGYEKAFAHAKETGTDLVCVMVDIDRFKSINDNYGHATGDRVLRMVADILRKNSRARDLVGRYGGEEFCLVLTDTGHRQGTALVERLRGLIQSSSLGRSESAVRVTASFGLALLTDDIPQAGDLTNRADQALYWAKDGGRNRVVTWSEKADGSTEDRKRAEVIPLPCVTTPMASGESELLIQDSAMNDELEALKERRTDQEPGGTGELPERQVGQDLLTSLPNRTLFCDRIRQALDRGPRYDRMVAVISLDIDTFNRINDTLGYAIGDQLLRQVAERLVSTLRSADTVSLMTASNQDTKNSSVSRLNNDQFGILVTDLADVKAVAWVVKRLFEKLSNKFEVDGHEIFITCSAGVSLYPHDSIEIETLLQYASIARNDAKRQVGNNNMRFYSADINKAAYRQLWLENQLHRAVEGNQFSLHYQPIVDFGSDRIRGMEALLRWNHPEEGSIPPAEFIPIAEHSRLIDSIGEWVLRTACEQGQQWRKSGHDDVRIIVNLSTLQFHQKNLAGRILTIVDDTGLPYTCLEFEITETTLMNDFHVAEETIQRLHDAGMKFAIDDFGIGYSSLSSLKNLPVDTLKIDRSFLPHSQPSEQEKMIMQAIISMGHSLGLKVVAEGVETAAQKLFLYNLKCDEFQGFLFSKPLSSEAATKLLEQKRSKLTDTGTATA